MSSISVRSKPAGRPLPILAILFAALWILMVVTWMYDDEGYTMGMPMPVFIIVLASPLVAGLIAGFYQDGPRLGVKAGMITGAFFGAANIFGNVVWGWILSLQGRIPPNQPFTFWEGVFEALGFLVLFVIIGLVLGAIGGYLGAALGRRRQHAG